MRILFVAWDAAHVNYLEGLFVPVFAQVANDFGHEFHIIQFSWAGSEKVTKVKALCDSKSISYSHVDIRLKPIAAIGKYLTLSKGVKIISDYIILHSIDVLMPRSSMPAKMSLDVLKGIPKLKVAFDADGLPIEERMDFAGLQKGSFRYRMLKKIEGNILTRADIVLTRSKKAIDILKRDHQIPDASKFHVVRNGRDVNKFRKKESAVYTGLKQRLGLPPDAFVLVYCGSLGPQYGVDEMIYIHRKMMEKNPNAFLLMIVTNPEFFEHGYPEGIRNVVVRSVDFDEVPSWLSVGSVAFAIRKPTYSMQGVSPIKLGEYLLMGLPTIASSGIGDTEEILSGQEFAFLLEDHSQAALDKSVAWIGQLTFTDALENKARNIGKQYFSLEASAEGYGAALSGLN